MMNLEILQKRKKQNIHTNSTIKVTGLKKPQKKEGEVYCIEERNFVYL